MFICLFIPYIDLETGTCKIKLPDNLKLCQTANLRTILEICVGARFFLTVNINVADKQINGLFGAIEYINFNNHKYIISIIRNIYQV